MTLALWLVLMQPDWAGAAAWKPGQPVMAAYAKSFAEGALVARGCRRTAVAGTPLSARRRPTSALSKPALE